MSVILAYESKHYARYMGLSTYLIRKDFKSVLKLKEGHNETMAFNISTLMTQDKKEPGSGDRSRSKIIQKGRNRIGNIQKEKPSMDPCLRLKWEPQEKGKPPGLSGSHIWYKTAVLNASVPMFQKQHRPPRRGVDSGVPPCRAWGSEPPLLSWHRGWQGRGHALSHPSPWDQDPNTESLGAPPCGDKAWPPTSSLK